MTNRLFACAFFFMPGVCCATLMGCPPIPSAPAPAVQAFDNPDEEASLKLAFQAQVQPLLQKLCYRCHNQDKLESGIRVDHLDGSLKDQQLFLWDEIHKQISQSAMPPEDETQFSEKEKKTLLDWLERSQAYARSRPSPKNGSIRRLTVSQYRNAIKELLGITDDLTGRLPPDAISKDGFTNNEKTMLLSPLLIEAYFEIAQKALDACIVDTDSKPIIQNFRMEFGRQINKQPSPDRLILGANSHLLANEDFIVQELEPKKNFTYQPFKMRTKFRFIEGYQGNSTVRGWKDFDSLYHAVFACMRGTKGYPKGSAYQLVPRGLLLRPAIPSAELFGIESTYGPKANFKISVRELPSQGNFRVKVQAARYLGGLLLDRGEKTIETGDVISFNHRVKSTTHVTHPGIYQVNLYNQTTGLSNLKADRSRLKKELVGSWSFEQRFQNHDHNPLLEGKPLGGAHLVNSPFGKAV
ncbi:MAG: DUF1587 domain-containing protein, partial [Planctomycetota bacterium]|nr:DUF1587 domain-containing protein [Planctomycetota bacterium]